MSNPGLCAVLVVSSPFEVVCRSATKGRAPLAQRQNQPSKAFVTQWLATALLTMAAQKPSTISEQDISSYSEVP